MESLSLFADGLVDLFSSPMALVYLTVGVFLGTVVGLIPGVGPSTAIALLLPLAMSLDPGLALIMMVSLYMGAEYGGRISAILLNMPGDAGAIMTTLDGHPLALAGKASRALKLSALSSFGGGFISVIGLVLLAGPLAAVAVGFGPSAYFAVVIMALILASTLVGAGLVKSLIAVVLGLVIATVGVDSQAGIARFTFGVSGLLDGINIIVVIIGLFGISEILHVVAHRKSGETNALDATGGGLEKGDVKKILPTTLRGSGLGFLAGVLPGSGTTLGAFLGYAIEKRVAKDKSRFGKGDIRGLAAPEAANNAAVGGSMVPTLALGIPGSGTAAVLLAYLTVYGLNPGPTFFRDQADLAWLIIAALGVSVFLGLALNYSFAPAFAKILRVPPHYLYSVIIVLALVSGYAVHGSIFDAGLVLVFGVIGFLLRYVGISSVLIVIGLVLGEMLERTMRQAYLLAHGSLADMLLQPLTLLFLGIGVIALLADMFARRKFFAKLENGTE